jgi:phosphoribosylaminoimidazole-succinocarboxamide synthase
MTELATSLELANYPLLRRGKVRDVFDLGDHLLLVASDRISAFDVVLPSLLTRKGIVLTEISQLWFDSLAGVVPTQVSDIELASLDLDAGELAQLRGRSMIVRKADRVDVECVVRAYLAGSAWKEYQQQGTVAGVRVPAGLKRGDPLPGVMFTPAIKNDSGHDENISRGALAGLVGGELARTLEQRSLELFAHGSAIAARAGFILADTKFEFGWIDGTLSVIDEVLTPDSSRYWDANAIEPGQEPAAFDKQPIRDWLESTGWNKQAPGPELPAEIAEETLARYQAVADRLRTVLGKGKEMAVDGNQEHTWNLEVIVMPKAGVNDPQGDAVRSGLHSLGFDTASRVRIGKRISIELAAENESTALEQGRAMCDQLLANPVIEEYSISIVPAQE